MPLSLWQGFGVGCRVNWENMDPLAQIDILEHFCTTIHYLWFAGDKKTNKQTKNK